MHNFNNYYSERTWQQRQNEFIGQAEHNRIVSEIKAEKRRSLKQWLFSKKDQTNPKPKARKEGLEWN